MTSYSQEQEFIPDGSTCDSCNAIFLDSTSRSIIITNVGTFRYCRKYDDLKRTAAAGCILCMPLLDRHEAESTKNIPDRMFCKSFGCPWGTVFDGNIVFLVMRPIPRRRPSFRGTHWALSFRGHREHGRRKYFWELIFDVAADDGESTKGSA
jgi:hypothetical protein